MSQQDKPVSDFLNEIVNEQEDGMDFREAIRERHSVRQYKPDPIPEDVKETLNMLIEECNKESGLHIQLIIDDPECFDSILGRYGKFSGANNYIAIAGSKKHPKLDETGGYYGEK